MAIVTPKINWVLLNKGADTFFHGENVAAPMGRYAAKDLASALDSLGDDVIMAEYHTVSDPKERAKDEAKFSKRLAALGPGWMRSEWRPQVISGYVHDRTMVCTLTRRTQGDQD